MSNPRTTQRWEFFVSVKILPINTLLPASRIFMIHPLITVHSPHVFSYCSQAVSFCRTTTSIFPSRAFWNFFASSSEPTIAP